MSTGAVIFAVGSSHHDYVRMAAWQAHRIRRWLDLPVTLITDQDTSDTVWDNVIKVHQSSCPTKRWFADINDSTSWNNHDRCDALDLTPYDRTLLLDADYVICSADLSPVIQHSSQIFCFQKCHDATTGMAPSSLNQFGSHGMPMSWCTVLCFSKNHHSELLFGCWRMVRDNWHHYRQLYGIHERLFRNDYALTIALHITNGHVPQSGAIPVSLCAVMPTTKLQSGEDADSFRLSYVDHAGKPRYQILQNQDFHAMGKKYLQELIDAA